MRRPLLATIALLIGLLVGFCSASLASTRTVHKPSVKELQSPVSAMDIGHFHSCMNDSPIAPNNLNIPSPLKDQPVPSPLKDQPVRSAWVSLRYWECRGDLD
jgi:hypothetical protein